MLQLEGLWTRIVEDDFSYGFFWGALLTLAVLLLLWGLNLLCAFLCRSRRCRELRILSEGGGLSVAEGAVVSAVKLLGESFPWLDLQRVRLYRSRGLGVELRINARYELSRGRSLPEEVSKFREYIRDGLSGMLGLPEEVKICINLVGVKGGTGLNGSDGHSGLPADSGSEAESGFSE